MPKVAPSELRAFALQLLCSAGMRVADADAAADCLVLANLRGVDSHGVLRLKQYLDTIRTGGVNLAPDVRVVQRSGATAVVDADGGYGFRPALLAADIALDLAGANGCASVAVRNSHHFGMAATYAQRVAAGGMVSYVTTNTLPVMPPWGGTRALLGNNPVAWAVPRRPPAPPIVLDLALSRVAFGRIRHAAAEGREIPEGWAFDREGKPTTDAEEALEAAMLMPVGGYKGAGLALIGEVLAGALTGSPLGAAADAHGRRSGGVGHLICAWNPSCFTGEEDFLAAVEDLVAQVKGMPPAAGFDGIQLPGEIEQGVLARRTEGIPLSEDMAAMLEDLSMQQGVEGPRWLPAEP